jgi:hypothetical protein
MSQLGWSTEERPMRHLAKEKLVYVNDAWNAMLDCFYFQGTYYIIWKYIYLNSNWNNFIWPKTSFYLYKLEGLHWVQFQKPNEKIQEKRRLVILRIPNNNVIRSGGRRILPSKATNLGLKRSLHLSLLEDKLVDNLLPSNGRLRHARRWNLWLSLSLRHSVFK